MTNFLWGAASSAYQIEGNNTASDWWWIEHQAQSSMERSGDAVDSYHRYPEDMRLLAEAGLNTYRFSLEWARIEPAPGEFSRAALAHYRRMIDTALGFGLTPFVTLQHFTHPLWFSQDGGWHGPKSVERFARYAEQAATILHDVPWVCTINEPNVETLSARLVDRFVSGEATSMTVTTPDIVLPTPDRATGSILAEAHAAAKDVLRENTDAKTGWTVACQALTPTPGSEDKFAEVKYAWEDFYLEQSRGDDYVGVQSYTSQTVDENGIVPHPESPDNTLAGWAYRPDALGIAIRNAAEVTPGTPIVVTENGIATHDDERRIRYTDEALRSLFDAVDDGIDVRGYLHWSALDNFEWGHWEPTFGLIAVDRTTFERTPKPSLRWLGEVARKGRLQEGDAA
ncbi:family 1 glycosylhydrolase [Streptomyces sp. SID8361]|uniref:glycoside hydrolase family 1 protein n=1 Tax=Streptomyces sp. MnatMP-M27 TaxID=1839768 RepID=UPI00081E995D|nr:family 1 glycosylhydrolase [Streptomyces sp. MnatMP-M27]MYU16950.1 family 1 glycosylhydrolase [Streptomyces sp. SID8361]SCG11521.1 beta-glucosidase [Streptomyces sp. MnatMP-M27]